MKKILLLLPFTFLSVPAQPVQAQNVACVQYQESYQPGGYDRNGNYIQSQILVQRYYVPCNSIVVSQQYIAPQYYPQQRYCSPERTAFGALLGGSIAGAISGKGYEYGGSYYNNYSYGRRSGSYSGGWNRYDKPNYWVGLGTAIGGLAYSC